MGGICCAEDGGKPVESVSTMAEGTAEVAAEAHMVEESAWEETAFEEAALEETALEETALEETALKETALKETALEQTVSEEPAPEQENPLEDRQADLLFQLPDGEQKLVVVGYRPLGVGFTTTVPLSVKAIKPGSVGEEMMIMPQWSLLEINGANATNMSSEEALQMLAQAFDLLPERL